MGHGIMGFGDNKKIDDYDDTVVVATNCSSNIYMGVSKNRGTPKSSHFNRVFHYFHHPFWGFSPYFWKHPYDLYVSAHDTFGDNGNVKIQ